MNCPHCNAHIDEHPASRCLDAWAAEAVMGFDVIWGIRHVVPKMPPEHPQAVTWLIDGKEIRTDVPRYSTDIAAAWRVVEKLGECHLTKTTTLTMCKPRTGTFKSGSAKYVDGAAGTNEMPLAICRAAIKAVQG